MGSFRIEWKKPAVKELRGINGQDVARMVRKVEALRAEPFPPGCCKLAGCERAWRIRVGDYGVLYEVWQDVLVIEVVRVGHRRDVYER